MVKTSKMEQKSYLPAPVLLATDFSARCDRALDRAAQLAAQWQVELIAVNVFDRLQNPEMVLNWAYGDETENLQILQRQLQEDVADTKVPMQARLVTGDPATRIAELASDINCAIIITGMARNELLGRFITGSTVEKLSRLASQPLLVVRKRPHGAYSKILVATDFSDGAAHALHAALRMFPENQIVLYHACKPGLSRLAAEHEKVLQPDSLIEAECDKFLEKMELEPTDRKRIHFVAEYGGLESVLTHYVRQHGFDLVVLGSHGQSGLMSSLLGSSASRLLNWLTCDTMLVGGQGARQKN